MEVKSLLILRETDFCQSAESLFLRDEKGVKLESDPFLLRFVHRFVFNLPRFRMISKVFFILFIFIFIFLRNSFFLSFFPAYGIIRSSRELLLNPFLLFSLYSPFLFPLFYARNLTPRILLLAGEKFHETPKENFFPVENTRNSFFIGNETKQEGKV